MNGASTRKSLDSRLRGNDGAWPGQTGIVTSLIIVIPAQAGIQ